MLEEEEEKREMKATRTAYGFPSRCVRACWLLAVAKGDSIADARGFVMKPSLDGNSFLRRREN